MGCMASLEKVLNVAMQACYLVTVVGDVEAWGAWAWRHWVHGKLGGSCIGGIGGMGTLEGMEAFVLSWYQ